MDAANSAGGDGGIGASSNSSDFVRKLFKMLEDPSHKDIVRWNETGDSFIVVDTNDFTKKILPNHFKHCNFASFVRQLNKYDFHKIRNYDAGGGGNQHQAWEFKHPDFQKHNKDNLDNIRRKAPAPRKQQSQGDEAGLQQIEVLQSQVRDLLKSQSLMDARVQSLTSENHAVVRELQNTKEMLQAHQHMIHSHDSYLHKLIQFLWKMDAEIKELRGVGGKRDGEHSEVVSPTGGNTGFGAPATSSNDQNGSSTPLQQAQRLMSSFAEITKGNSSLQNMSDIGQPNQPESVGGYEDYSQLGRHLQNGHRSNSMQNGGIQSVGPDGNHMYNIGASSGMSDVYGSGQVGNITFPITAPNPENGTLNSSARPNAGRKKSSSFVTNWATPPRVLLVEDDPTCARIGTKFLQTAQCGVDMATDGLGAVKKLGSNKYDLVLMDIVMPLLDGVSAAALIRQFDKDTPIIAMTSNIRRDDIQSYFSNGMNDVLPKPFTKEGLLKLLERCLSHLKVNKNTGQIPHQLSFNGPDNDNGGPLVKPTNSLKYSHSPSKSPNLAIYGRSPNDIDEDPIGEAASALDNSYLNMMGPYVDNNNTHDQASNYSSPANSSRGLRRGASEMDDHPSHLGGIDIKKARYLP
ncbi:uncharacterized protein H6S33_012813 [Morchella sextelata]|uniref:uncharacterized protein n=1 Tax=Morchella sextelata TaxID=1174677 RepID=UPI001D040A93|nr:uncharacterized protein H6S33_012813 [Morchella sextelata]KAH0609327.1 hypothetical protein H6S33_012813 [Morchella sextelata]